jgi:acyl carrier protein
VDDVRQRLIKCFSAVFPELTEDQILRAGSDGTNNWDSLSQVTLISVIQEEFSIEFGVDLIQETVSFANILARISEAAGSSLSPEAPPR